MENVRRILGFFAMAMLAWLVMDANASPMAPGSSRDALSLMPDVLLRPSVASSSILAYRSQLVARLHPFRIPLENAQPVVGTGNMRSTTLTNIRFQMYRNYNGKHFIPLSSDGRGHSVYALELSHRSIRGMDSAHGFGMERQKRFALIGVQQRSPSTDLSLHQTQPEVSLYGFVDVTGLPTTANIASLYDDHLSSQNLYSILRG